MSLPIQDGGLIATRLQRLLKIVGKLSPSLEEYVIPTIQVADLSEGGLPAVVRHASANFAIAAVGGTAPLWRLEVPPGIIAVIDKIDVRPTTTATQLTVNFSSSISPADIPTLFGGAFTDGRLRFNEAGAAPASVFQTGTRIAPLAGDFVTQVPVVPDNRIIEPKGWIVGSGNQELFDFLEMGLVTLAVAVNVTVEWFEFQNF